MLSELHNTQSRPHSTQTQRFPRFYPTNTEFASSTPRRQRNHRGHHENTHNASRTPKNLVLEQTPVAYTPVSVHVTQAFPRHYVSTPSIATPSSDGRFRETKRHHTAGGKGEEGCPEYLPSTTLAVVPQYVQSKTAVASHNRTLHLIASVHGIYFTQEPRQTRYPS